MAAVLCYVEDAVGVGTVVVVQGPTTIVVLSLIVSGANTVDIKGSAASHHRGVVGYGASHEYVRASVVGKGTLIAETVELR